MSVKTLPYLFVCYSDIGTARQLSSTTSTSTVKCSPRWFVYHNIHSPGVQGNRVRQVNATTQQQCLDACVVDAHCVAADWVWRYNPPECWLHYTPYPQRPRRQHNGITQFEIVRRCNPASGMLRVASKCSSQNCFVRSVTTDFTSASLDKHHRMYFCRLSTKGKI